MGDLYFFQKLFLSCKRICCDWPMAAINIQCELDEGRTSFLNKYLVNKYSTIYAHTNICHEATWYHA